MGPWGGFLTGLAENAEYVITTAVVGGAIALLAQSTVADLFDITGDPFWNSEPFWWAVFYIVFLAINISGVEATFRFTVGITVVAMGILIVFYVAALVSGEFSPDLVVQHRRRRWARRPTVTGSFLPFGISGIFKALPFAIWFYLAIEEVPLAAEESMDPRRDVPKGTIRGMHTLLLAQHRHPAAQLGRGRRRARDRRVRHPAVRRLQGDLRRQHRRRAARHDGPRSA